MIFFKYIGDCQNKDDASNVNTTKTQHNKDVKNEQKMINNMTSLEYVLPQERDLKKNPLPRCLKPRNKIHKFDTEKAYWIGFYTENKKKCSNCQIMSVNYMRNK